MKNTEENTMLYEDKINDIVPERISTSTSELAKAVSEYNIRTRALKEFFNITGVKPFYELKTLPYLFETFVGEILSVRPNIYPDDKNDDVKALDNLKKALNEYDKYYAYVLKELGGTKYRFLPETILALDVFSHQINHFVIKGKVNQAIINEIKKIRIYCTTLKNSFGDRFTSYWDGDMSKTQALQIARYAEQNNILIDILTLGKMANWFKAVKEKFDKEAKLGKKEKYRARARHTEKQQLLQYIDIKTELRQLEHEVLMQNANPGM